MAVDVLHLSPGQSLAKMAFGGEKSVSSEELSRESGFPESSTLSASTGSSAKSSVISLDDGSFSEQEMKAVEQLEASRRQLESEIDVSQAVRKPEGRVNYQPAETNPLCGRS